MLSILSIDVRTGESLGPVAAETSATQVQQAVARASAAAPWLRALGRAGRAELLDGLAAALESRADDLIALADRETALDATRLAGELVRTCFQLRFMGEVAVEGSYLDVSIEHPGTTPMGPRPDLRRMNVPIGPVAVFGSSNFPFAFSAPGGDTASALAAGCPVIVKAHGSHAGLSALVAEIFGDTLRVAGAPDGVFQLVFGREAGTTLVASQGIRGVGFTGSVSGGRALFDVATSRPEPIPFYGELGSVNPLVVTAAAAAERARTIGSELAASMTLGAGQFCTKPGLFLVPTGESGEDLVDELALALAAVDPAFLLNETIAGSFRSGVTDVLSDPHVQVLFQGMDTERQVAPVLVEVLPGDLHERTSQLLTEEYFGPFGVVVRYHSLDELRAILAPFPPALTGTVHSTGTVDPDLAEVAGLLLERSGRLVFDGYPTGVAVAWGMNHGGQYPASTSAATSVGAGSIMRWLRPVAYQNAPASILPRELRDDFAEVVPRRIDGAVRVSAASEADHIPTTIGNP